MTDPIWFALMFGAFCFVSGFLLRGAVNAIRLNRETTRAENEGYTRAILLISGTTRGPPPDQELSRKKLSIVKF